MDSRTATARRIAIIGAGSAYMPSVIRGLISRASTLGGSELVFHDTHQEHVELLATLARAMFSAAEVDYSVVVEPTLAGAITDADFVFTTFRPGGLPARYLDETIPLRHCILGQETIGPGGFFMAQRAIPVMLEIARVTQERAASGAWIVNYTNPTNIVTDAVRRHGGFDRILGICDQYVHDQKIWAQALGIDPQGLEVDWFGTNHCTWATTIRSNGEDISARVRERLAMLAPTAMRDPYDAPLAQLGADFGYLVNHYVRYYYTHDDIVAGLRERPTTRAQDIMADLPRIYADFKEQAGLSNPTPDSTRGGTDWGEFAIDTICAIAGDEGTRLIVNVRNGDSIPELEPEAIVELPALVDARGAHALPVGPLPHPARGLSQAVHEYEMLAADAAARGDERVALTALMAHPVIRSRRDAAAILREGLSAHREFLPQFSVQP